MLSLLCTAVAALIVKVLLASERSERDTIRGNKWKSEIYIYINICICNSTGRSEIRDKCHEC